MAWPQSPLPVAVDLLTPGGPVALPVLLAQGIAIDHGRSPESRVAEPGSCTLSVRNTDDGYSPHDPRSPLYGVLARGAWLAVRVRPDTTPAGVTPTVTDAFTRTVASGWGTSTSGTVWLTGGTSSVNGSQGVLTPSGPAAATVADLFLPAVDSAEVVATVTWPVATGGPLEAEVAVGGVSAFGSQVRIRLFPGGAVTVRSTSSTAAEVTVPGLVHTGQPLRVRVHIVGPWAYARVWDPAAGSEPAAWQAVHFQDAAIAPRRGRVRIRAGRDGANTNTGAGMLVDDVTVTTWITRFAGQITSLRPSAPGDGGLHRARRVDIRASSTLQALSRDSAAPSPMRRSTPSQPALAAYWPLEDAAETLTAGQVLTGVRGERMRVEGGTSRGLSSVFFGSRPVPVLGTASMVGEAPGTVASTGVTVQALVAFPDDLGAQPFPILTLYTEGTLAAWELLTLPPAPGSFRLSRFTRDGTGDYILQGSQDVVFNPAGRIGLVQLRLTQAGGFIAPVATAGWQDETTFGQFTYPSVAGTIGRVTGVRIGRPGQELTGLAIGHVQLYSEPVLLGALGRELQGWVGERPAGRVARVARESGTPAVSYAPAVPWGDPLPGPGLGYQPISSVQDVLEDAAVDGVIVVDRATGLPGLRGHRLTAAAVPVAVSETEARDVSLLIDDRQPGARVVVTAQGGGDLATLGDAAAGWSTSVSPTTATVDAAVLVAGVDLARGQVVAPRGSLTVELARVPGRVADLAAVEPGTPLRVTGVPAWRWPHPVDLVVLSVRDTIDLVTWTVEIEGEPGDPWRGGLVETGSAPARASAWRSTLTSAVTATATSIPVTSVDYRWVTAADHAASLPLDVVVRGEVMTVTGVTGTGLAQTLAVIRGVQGVAAAHPLGAEVQLFRPARAY